MSKISTFLLILLGFLASCSKSESEKQKELLQKQLNSDPCVWSDFRPHYPYQRMGADNLPLRLLGTTTFSFKPSYITTTLNNQTEIYIGSWLEPPLNDTFVSDKGDSIVVYPDLLKWYRRDSSGTVHRSLYLSNIHNHID